MEISRQDFIQKLPIVKAAIEECDFMAIDTELSGLHRPGTGKRIETLDCRYKEYKEATERFSIIQFGLCTFKWDQPSGRYIAKPFNFYIFATSFGSGKATINRVFHVQAQAFDFLAKQAFDFNKWIYQGIPYMTLEEEERFVNEKKKMLENKMPDIPIDDKELGFLNAAREKIDAWLEGDKDKKKDNSINIDARNAYQRRLIYQEVRNKYKGLTAEGRRGFIQVMQLTEEQQQKRKREREELFKADCDNAIGFRRVIDWISASKKPLVGHNMLLDMCHIIGQFVQALPDTKEEFKSLARRLFPIMIDTKHIAISCPEIQIIADGGTDLENLRFETSREAFKNPRVDMGWEYPRYVEEKAHEAGYDAYMTGTIFIKMMSYLDSQRKENWTDSDVKVIEPEEEIKQEKVLSVADGGWNAEEDEDVDPNWTIDDSAEEVYNYGSTEVLLMDSDGTPIPLLQNVSNKAVLARAAYPYFDFTQPEKYYIQQSNAILLHVNQQILEGSNGAIEVLSEFGNYIVEYLDEQKTLIVFERISVDKYTLKASLADRFKSKSLHIIVD